MRLASVRRPTPVRPLKAMVIASLLAPALVFCLAAWDGYRQEFRDAENRGAHINRLLEEHAAKTLETIVLLVRQTERRLRGVSDEEIATSRSVWEEIDSFQQMSEQVDSIFVLDRDGRNLLTTRVYPSPPGDFADRDYFTEQATVDRGVFLGQAYLGRISNRMIFNLSIRRSTADGAFAGVIGSSAFVTYFETFYANVAARDDNPVVALVREDGAPLVSYPPMTPESSTAPISALAAAATGPEAGTFWLTDGGVQRLFTYQKIEGYPAYVAYGIDRQAILSGWYEHLIWWGILSASVAALLCFTSLIALGRARHEARAVSQWKRTSSDLYQEIERRERAEAALLQAQKLEALGQLTGGIAHDFNNLLTIILGSLASAERQAAFDTGDEDKLRKRLRDARYAAERAESLTRQLLAFSRRQELKPESVDLPDVLERCRSPLERALGGGIGIEVDLPRDLWPAWVDPAQFETALLNLAINARDAMPDGGTFRIEARNEEADARDVPKLAAGSYVRIEVRDDGVGIPADVLPRIFEPFFTTKEIGKGTGLGMSQVHGFIQQSGGAIEADSEPGVGTTIVIHLPRASVPTHHRKDADSADDVGYGSGSILVVEDNIEVRAIIVSLLEEAGYRTTVAADAREALAIMASGVRFDLMLSDIVMPNGMSGLDLAREVRRTHPATPVVLMTGYPGHRTMLRENEFTVLKKPVSARTLARSVRRALQAAI